MDEFFSMISDQLGIGEAEGRAATGGILKIIKEQLDDSTFHSVLEKLPGADAVLGEAEAGGGDGGGGLMGSLTSMAGSLLGGENSGAAGIAEALGSAGIGLDQVGGFMTTLIAFLKDKLGDDLFATFASGLPELLGGSDN